MKRGSRGVSRPGSGPPSLRGDRVRQHVLADALPFRHLAHLPAGRPVMRWYVQVFRNLPTHRPPVYRAARWWAGYGWCYRLVS